MRFDFAIIFSVVAIALIAVSLFNFQFVLPSKNKINKFNSYAELQNFLRTNLARSSYSLVQTLGTTAARAAEGAEVGKEVGKAAAAAGAEDYSTTNIQVAGVDEADIVKNDGKYVYTITGNTITGNKVVILDAFPAEQAKILSTLEFNGSLNGIFVNGDRLVVFGNQFKYYVGPIPLARSGGATSGGVGGVGAEVGVGGVGVAKTSICPLPNCGFPYSPPKAFVYIYDISERENPVLKRNITLDGNYFNSRMIGEHVYVIFNSYINNVENVSVPVIEEDGREIHIPVTDVYYFDYPDSSYQFTTILAINTQNDAAEIGKQEILMGYTQNIFVSLNNIYVTYQKPFSYYDYQIRLLDKAILPILPADISSQIFVIKNSNIPDYEKFQKISDVLQKYEEGLSDEERANIEKAVSEKSQEVQEEIQKEFQKTVIHKIAIDSGRIEYKANGEVPGYVLNQFSMDEHDGYFRIATTTRSNMWWGPIGIVGGGIVGTRTEAMTAETESVSAETTVARQERVVSLQELQEEAPAQRPQSLNHVYVLDSDLKIVGRLENLAPDESIYSARFLGDRAYLVTFRRIDPLFVIDLSSPTSPKVLGKLKIPGYSDYLHPYDETHIIGIGKEVLESEGGIALMQGVKLGLFDVSDPENPKEIAKYEIGSSGTDSEALRDHHAFLFSKEKNLLVIPILLVENVFGGFTQPYTWQGAYVFDLTLDSGFTLKGRITHAPINATNDYYYYYGPYSVKRSLYIDGVLYTISESAVKMNDLQSLSEIRKVDLPKVDLPISQQEIFPLIK